MGRLEEIKERYKGPMMNEDIRWCTDKIDRFEKTLKRIRDSDVTWGGWMIRQANDVLEKKE